MEIYLNLPAYLKQWLSYKCCGEYWIPGEPQPEICFAKGSIESNILLISLRTPRAGEIPMVRCPEGWTRVRVPNFRGVNLDSRNYLPEKARSAIEGTIRARFDIDLWPLISHREFKIIEFKDALSCWMDSRGIEDDEVNWMAISKRAHRLRSRAIATQRQRDRRKKQRENE